MLFYRWFSPQSKLESLMQRLQAAQQEMNDYDGEFEGMLPLIKSTLSLAMQRVWLSFVPSLIAAVPLILVMVCIGSIEDSQLDQQVATTAASVSSVDSADSINDGMTIENSIAVETGVGNEDENACLLYTSPSPRDATLSRMPSSA